MCDADVPRLRNASGHSMNPSSGMAAALLTSPKVTANGKAKTQCTEILGFLHIYEDNKLIRFDALALGAEYVESPGVDISWKKSAVRQARA